MGAEQIRRNMRTALAIHTLRDANSRLRQIFGHVFIDHNCGIMLITARYHMQLVVLHKDLNTVSSSLPQLKIVLSVPLCLKRFHFYIPFVWSTALAIMSRLELLFATDPPCVLPLELNLFFLQENPSLTKLELKVSSLVFFSTCFT